MKRFRIPVLVIGCLFAGVFFIVSCGGGGGGGGGDGGAQSLDPGSYTYTPLAVAGLGNAVDMAYHPDGSYLLIVGGTGAVHAVNTASETSTVLDITPAGETLLWEDVDFDPSGSFAILTGMTSYASTVEGVIYRFDDSAWRSYGGNPATVLTEYTGLPVVKSYAAIAYPWGTGQPVVLGRTNPGTSNIAYLYEFDPGTGIMTSLGAKNTAAGCQDIGFVTDGLGSEAVLVVCGINGADAFYYSEPGGIGGFIDLSTVGMGNMSYLAPHNGGDYAIIIDWSGRKVRRYESGLFDPSVFTFGTMGIYRATFSHDGSRALIYGRAGGTPLSAPVMEYRHGSYSCTTPFTDCALTDVSIPNFGDAPYLGTANTWLHGADWSPVCDGGLLVGGDTTSGIAIKFNLTGGTACW